MQVIPSTLRDLWTTWELPVMVLLSLFLQLILIPIGRKRKYSSNNYLRWLLWLAYLSADSVATISLGILSNGGGHSLEPRYIIRAFWAPFFLLHLGGPDTITAYSIQDNDMWLRHFLGLLIQVTFSFYIFLQALQPTAMNFIAIPVFVAGIIKYGERTWVLRSTSFQRLRDQDVPLKTFDISNVHDFKLLQRIREESSRFIEIQILHIAYNLFQRNKWVFVDLILSFDDLQENLHYFKNFDFKTAFKVVELELGLLHDFFYTKASLIHTRWGALLRLISLSSIVVAIIAFCTSNKHRYPFVDVYLTFILLFGALGVEIYSLFSLLCSDWCVIWLSKFDNFLARLTLKAIYGFGWSLGKKRWSNSVPQYNLLTHCFEDIKGEDHKFLRNLYTTKIMTISQPISDELRKGIFEHSNEMLKCMGYKDKKSFILASWIQAKHSFYGQLGWSMELDFAQSILLWHIATEVCYYFDHKNKALNSSVLEDAKLLSHYLMHLLSNRNSLFSNGMNRTRIDAIVNEINNFLGSFGEIKDAYEYILKDLVLLDYSYKYLDNLGIRSALKHGCFLARELQGRLKQEQSRWELIRVEWIEMLVTVACECKTYDHIEQLGHGGDLLTHVWLFMHHIGYIKHTYHATTATEKEKNQQFLPMVGKLHTDAESSGVCDQESFLKGFDSYCI